MQIRLTKPVQDMLDEYKKLCRSLIPAYAEKPTTIANGMLTDKLRSEIQRMKRKKQ